ncbi:MAG: hypothetical protein ACYDAD_02315 [Acidimicrobiales bacterium]
MSDPRDPAPGGTPDPVLARRARIARLTEMGQRVGYGCFGVAVAVFVAGAISGFTSAVVVVVLAALGVGSAVLAPSIVFGYAVRAADRQDREDRGRG